MRVKFLHSSDFQIGMTRWFLTDTDDAQARFDAARKQAITRLGELAIAHECNFIVVAGDVFEHNAINTATKKRAIAALADLPMDVYLLPGNHDPANAGSILTELEQFSNLHVLMDTTPQKTAKGEAQIIGAPWLSKTPTTDLAAQALMGLTPTTDIRILVAHGQVENRSNEIKPDLIDLPNLEAALARGVIDYVALGDTHSAQSIGETGAVWFSGSPEVTDFKEVPVGGGEQNSGKALVVSVEKLAGESATVTVEEVQIGTWVFDAIDYELYTRQDVADFIALLESYPNKDETVIKYSLRGELDIVTRQLLEQQLAELAPLFANLYPRLRTTDLRTRASEDAIAELQLSGFGLATVKELQQSSDPAAEDALSLLFRLSQGGK